MFWVLVRRAFFYGRLIHLTVVAFHVFAPSEARTFGVPHLVVGRLRSCGILWALLFLVVVGSHGFLAVFEGRNPVRTILEQSLSRPSQALVAVAHLKADLPKNMWIIRSDYKNLLVREPRALALQRITIHWVCLHRHGELHIAGFDALKFSISCIVRKTYRVGF
jgi:hypothetical protein